MIPCVLVAGVCNGSLGTGQVIGYIGRPTSELLTKQVCLSQVDNLVATAFKTALAM